MSFAATGAGPRLYTFGGTDGGHKFNEVRLAPERRIILLHSKQQEVANYLSLLQLHELDFETYNWTLPPVHGTPPVPR